MIQYDSGSPEPLPRTSKISLHYDKVDPAMVQQGVRVTLSGKLVALGVVETDSMSVSDLPTIVPDYASVSGDSIHAQGILESINPPIVFTRSDRDKRKVRFRIMLGDHPNINGTFAATPADFREGDRVTAMFPAQVNYRLGSTIHTESLGGGMILETRPILGIRGTKIQRNCTQLVIHRELLASPGSTAMNR